MNNHTTHTDTMRRYKIRRLLEQLYAHEQQQAMYQHMARIAESYGDPFELERCREAADEFAAEADCNRSELLDLGYHPENI